MNTINIDIKDVKFHKPVNNPFWAVTFTGLFLTVLFVADKSI